MPARFVFVGRAAGVSPTDLARGGSLAVLWRLLGANNHELGRSAVQFGSLDEASAAVSTLIGTIASAQAVMEMDQGDGAWTWYVEVRGVRVAVSGRRYSRQRECRYSLDQFLSLAPTAEISEVLRAGDQRRAAGRNVTDLREVVRPEPRGREDDGIARMVVS